jgi:hypothetical protein
MLGRNRRKSCRKLPPNVVDMGQPSVGCSHLLTSFLVVLYIAVIVVFPGREASYMGGGEAEYRSSR